MKSRGLISITLSQQSMVYAMLVHWHDGGNCIALNKARDIIDRGYVALHILLPMGLDTGTLIQACMCVLDCNVVNIKEIFQSQRMTLLLLPARSYSFQYLNSPQKPDVNIYLFEVQGIPRYQHRFFVGVGQENTYRSRTLKSRGSYGNTTFFFKRSQYISLYFYVLRKPQKAKCGT